MRQQRASGTGFRSTSFSGGHMATRDRASAPAVPAFTRGRDEARPRPPPPQGSAAAASASPAAVASPASSGSGESVSAASLAAARAVLRGDGGGRGERTHSPRPSDARSSDALLARQISGESTMTVTVPEGAEAGDVLYVMGPSEEVAARQRHNQRSGTAPAMPCSPRKKINATFVVRFPLRVRRALITHLAPPFSRDRCWQWRCRMALSQAKPCRFW